MLAQVSPNTIKYTRVKRNEVRKITRLIQYMDFLPIIMYPISYKDYRRPGDVSLASKYISHDYYAVIAAKTIIQTLRGIPACRKANGRPTMPPPISTETMLKAPSHTVSKCLSSFFLFLKTRVILFFVTCGIPSVADKVELSSSIGTPPPSISC